MNKFATATSSATSARSAPLSKDQVASFFENGFLILPKLYTHDEVAAVNAAVDRAWGDRSIYNNLTLSGYTGSSRYTETYLRHIDPTARSCQYKLNHLYLYDPRVLDLLLADKLQNALAQLLEATPLMFNGLNMEHGTEQRMHIDTFYMPPRTFGKMVATWMALEDIHPDSGVLNYVPKSNQISPYRFSHGGIWAVENEMPAFDAYFEPEVRKRGLSQQGFCPKKGDVFIWHAQLFHGGGKINNRSLTRKSMVNHFWTVEDYHQQAVEVRPGKYILRNQDMFVSTSFVERPAV